MRIFFIFLYCCFFVNISLWSQLEKGDWMLDFQLKTHSEFTQLTNGRSFLNTENLQLKCGRFLSDGFVAGLRYSLIKERNQQLGEPFGKMNYSMEEHRFGAFLRYYFGQKPEKKLLFIKSDWTWSYINYQSTQAENTFVKILDCDVGMGLSLFKFPNAAIEIWLDYNLLRITGNNLSESAHFGRSRLIFYTAFQIYLNREFKSKWASKGHNFLQKGRQIISGNIEYNGINSGFFTYQTSIPIDLAYGKFISNHWLLGGIFSTDLVFVAKRIDFDAAIGPFARYYQPLTERLQLFGHFSITTNIIGKNHTEIRGFDIGNWSFIKKLEPTLGLGMNLFLNDDLSAFWLYKYSIPKDFSAIDLSFWDVLQSTLTLDMGFAFWF